MSYKISDIPTHNATPGGTNKIEMENPAGPNSEWATLAEIFAALGGAAGGITWAEISTTTTAVASHGYMCNTSSAAFTLTLPASPAIGDTVTVCDLTGSFATHNLTVARNGHPIGGLSEDMTVSTANVRFDLVYSDSTNGWKVI